MQKAPGQFISCNHSNNSTVVAGGIANGVVGDAVAIKGGQQLLPVGIPVGEGVAGGSIGGSQDITRLKLQIYHHTLVLL